jgi:hypothetical protein
VSVPTLLLSTLIVLRLLMPPGICVCKLSSPASRWLAAAWGAELPPPPPPTHTDDDHAPGCPASSLAEGLGVAPPPGPGPVSLLLTCFGWSAVPGTETTVAPAGGETSPGLALPGPTSIARAPLYVAHCALLF